MDIETDNIAYLLALHSIDGLGPIRLKHLLDYYQDPKSAYLADRKELLKILPSKLIDLLLETRKKLDPQKYIEEIEKKGISYLSLYSPDYPPLLKEIYNPPIVLYFQGDLKKADGKNIAVVGTRKITGYGKLVTEKFASFLASAGLTIVSGLARGVDTIAHSSAIKTGGQTIAVLGGGLNQIFPAENTNLAEKIIKEGLGAVISEFPPDYPPLPGNFPSRNRIISGLSLAVLVTEAAADSGSLITAKCALEQGREVLAIPGPITSDYSQGPLALIKQGAKLISQPEEILEELGLDKIQPDLRKTQSKIELSGTEKRLLDHLKNENRHIDEVCRDLNLPSAQVSASLVKMEIYGLVKNLGGGIYTKI